ncbi:hypothetical protein M419DRAFT_123877 [Trichoderma reesei RUT C-30]|uniref:Uncharacterized protein n=1 Tax=Hypocrea jecorina (strain ATCC 56765 / BCRC 32924 / NRRL 11460 / Rut C-30) TaxID=1344414 RepID=A0A024S827_HYPJR|nr:hypothetical protein M419DRAFT_123877 [Trichoderma reesei RUT C-30]
MYAAQVNASPVSWINVGLQASLADKTRTSTHSLSHVRAPTYVDSQDKRSKNRKGKDN